VGEALNCKEFTPYEMITSHNRTVGEALNCKEFTPYEMITSHNLTVGEALNCKEFTPEIKKIKCGKVTT